MRATRARAGQRAWPCRWHRRLTASPPATLLLASPRLRQQRRWCLQGDHQAVRLAQAWRGALVLLHETRCEVRGRSGRGVAARGLQDKVLCIAMAARQLLMRVPLKTLGLVRPGMQCTGNISTHTQLRVFHSISFPHTTHMLTARARAAQCRSSAELVHVRPPPHDYPAAVRAAERIDDQVRRHRARSRPRARSSAAQGLLPSERCGLGGAGAGGGSSTLPVVASSAARATCCSSVRSARAAGPSPSASPPAHAACARAALAQPLSAVP